MTRRIKMRTLLIGGLTTLFFIVLITRVFWIQVVNAGFWQDYAEQQWSKKEVIKATRGTITDRNGDTLAVDIPAYTVAVNPRIIDKYNIQSDVVEGLHSILNKPEYELLALVSAKDKDGNLYAQREVRLEGWKVDLEVKNKVEDLQKKIKEEHHISDSGISFVNETKRYYPQQTLASHILGYMNREGAPVSGLEAYYNKQLEGQDGELQYEADPKGIEVPKADKMYTPVKNGDNIQLTIDSTIQYYIETAMKKAYDDLKPISMTVIAADPNTMDILGMANMPTFNPNTYWEDYNPENFTNHALTSVYEPGSTFKIVTLAGAVQEGLFNPNETYQSGSIRVPGRTIHDINRSGWGTISFLEGVKRSSNVAFVKLGYEKLGPEKLKDYIEKFGFGQKTGIELPGELKGTVNMQYPADYAAASYGHGQLLVTPIQQVAAVSAVANGGKLLEPHIIKSITDPNTGKTTETKPKVVRQVISPENAKKVGSYLEQVVADQKIGTGRHAYIDGYRVAGKTGTAVKVVNGEYDYSKSIVSFIGYAPVNDPKILMLVVIDQPQNSELGGSTAAAPIFKDIVSKALPYMGVPKANVTTEKANAKTTSSDPTPALTGKALKDATNQLIKSGIAYETLGKGSKVISQFPKEGTPMEAGQVIYLLTEESKTMAVPDLTGESLRDAVEVLSLMGISVTAEGEGYVTSQTVTSNKDGSRKAHLKLAPPTTMESASSDDNSDPDGGITTETIKDSEPPG
ncbi:PASTA domain-containing penicillin-binding protein [Paenibacillus physcomitrellae]|uniref:Stage V sporulation protein D n=1 Tax=Paenibacillus physcomitrellae TaxID=1619311 RepID=A0ABQ1FMW3_9BACL|nr:PASTA domain-containing penicillin-binding protein [Paenibacillus physcomitrellae]GGA20823.1 stage V sporulation protein D [Paenibacillus physcomitrellae]